MKQHYEVIVVGAGPAGCILAHELACAGLEVLLLEKDELPRYKCCAGGITTRAAKLLPFDVKELAEDSISKVEVKYKDVDYIGEYEQNLIYTVKRDSFDYRLATIAKDAGATLQIAERVLSVESGEEQVCVHSSTHNFTGKYLVGADGAHSIVSRHLNLNHNFEYLVGINTDLSLTPDAINGWRGKVIVDTGCIPAGYAWVFPKLEHLSVGIASLKSKASQLNRYYQDFLGSLKLQNYSLLHQYGGLIPLCKQKPRLYRDRILLIGDAAGLADPITGEGIYHAILSAKLAAAALKQSLLTGTSRIEMYQQSVYQNILSEVRIARVLQKLFIHFPFLVTRLLASNPTVWKGCCLFARGEMGYSDALQKIGGLKGMKQILRVMLHDKTYVKAVQITKQISN